MHACVRARAYLKSLPPFAVPKESRQAWYCCAILSSHSGVMPLRTEPGGSQATTRRETGPREGHARARRETGERRARVRRETGRARTRAGREQTD